MDWCRQQCKESGPSREYSSFAIFRKTNTHFSQSPILCRVPAVCLPISELELDSARLGDVFGMILTALGNSSTLDSDLGSVSRWFHSVSVCPWRFGCCGEMVPAHSWRSLC